jgi:hypothetical protein
MIPCQTQISRINDILRITQLWRFYRYQRSITRIFRIDICRYVGDTTSCGAKKKLVLEQAHLYVVYSGIPALRKALIINFKSA